MKNTLAETIERISRCEERIAYLERQLSVLQPTTDNPYKLSKEYHHLIPYAEEVYDLYAGGVKSGNRQTSIRSICRLVKEGQIDTENLRMAVNNYIRYIAKNKTEKKYRIAPHNFFGQKSRYQEHMERELDAPLPTTGGNVWV